MFIITNTFLHGAVEIKSLDTCKIFKVNKHQLKPFYETFSTQQVEELTLGIIEKSDWQK